MLPPGKANPLSAEAPAARTTAPVAGQGVFLRPTTGGPAPGNLPDSQTLTGGTPMNRSRPITFLATAAAILLIAVGVASCGGSSGSSSNASNPPPATKPSQAVAAPN